MTEMWRPSTPFEIRMSQLSTLFNISEKDDPVLAAARYRDAQMDLRFRAWIKAIEQRHPSFGLTRARGGSKFALSSELRRYFVEYLNRLIEHGPRSFPSSFNVVESFLRFSPKFLAFDIREEREHLLRLTDFVDWYTARDQGGDMTRLAAILEEGVIYSYNFVDPTDDFRLTTTNSDLVVLGVSLVRHAHELSVMAVVGEAPPFPPDEEIESESLVSSAVKGKEGIKPDPSLTIANRYLDEAPGFVRVVGLARFDLISRRFNVRYANVDVGAAYRVATDDPTQIPPGLSASDVKTHEETRAQDLERYNPLFAFIPTAMYLPAFFASEETRIEKATFATDLHVERDTGAVKQALRILGANEVPYTRIVLYVIASVDSENRSTSLKSPLDRFTSEGFWKSLPPTDVGETPDGMRILGKTWVQRTEAWPAHPLAALVLRKQPRPVEGPDPGQVYIMRSDSHVSDLYKIGLTRRASETRAAELSRATAVPTPLEALATWNVGNVKEVEQSVHQELAPFRVNGRREFFRRPIADIIKVVEAAIASATGGGQRV